MSDSELSEIIDGCIRNDRRYQHRFYLEFGKKLLGICSRYAANRDEAQDLLQDALIKIFNNFKNYNRSGSFEGWLRRIVTNNCIDYYRKSKNELLQFDSEKTDRAGANSEDTEDSDSGYPEIEPAIILKEMNLLTPAYRMVFNLYAVDGYTHREIAEMLGINEGTSKSNLAKARRNLKSALSKYIVTHE